MGSWLIGKAVHVWIQAFLIEPSAKGHLSAICVVTAILECARTKKYAYASAFLVPSILLKSDLLQRVL